MRRKLIVAVLLAAYAPFAGAACAGRGETSAYQVRDSAGVKLVTNAARGAWATDSAWMFRETLRIDASRPDPNYQIGKVGGIAINSRGDILVVDALGHNVREYDSTGTFVRTFGAPGNGPGQLGAAVSTILVGRADTIFVPDVGNLRMDVFAPDGQPVRSFPLSVAQGVPAAWGVLPDGALLEQVRSLALPGQTGAPRNDLLVLDTEGSVRDTLLHLPVGFVPDMSKGPAAMKFRFFEPEGIWGDTPDGHVIAGVNSEYRLSVYDSTGALRMVITKPATRQPVTETDQKTFTQIFRDVLTKQLSRLGSDRAKPVIDQMIHNVEFAEYYPALGVIRGLPGGMLMVQHIATIGEMKGSGAALSLGDMQKGSRQWDVFDAGGRYLGVTELPVGFQLMAVRDDAFYGIETDSLDIPSVVRLVRAGAGGGN
ncbi:MAG TPA: hypothetical protein VJ992_01175 [Gemmatimonadales bacterium]|nr:hypothetical protein [Gemmatimonadales bacterium]